MNDSKYQGPSIFAHFLVDVPPENGQLLPTFPLLPDWQSAVAQAAGGIASLYGEKGSRMMTGQHAVADETGAMVASFALMGSYRFVIV